MNRDDFPILKQDIIYFDNSATTLKPKQVIDKMSDYYSNYSANAHRGDYDLSIKVDNEYENARMLVKNFINAKSIKEVIFTQSTTDSLNKIIFGFLKDYIKEDDEILTTYVEHASLILPLYEITSNIKFIELENNKVILENIKKSITNKTKVIALAHVTNVLGDVRPVKEIIKYAHSLGIIVIIDAAQSIPHLKIDVQDLDVDFLGFSGHKMLGPTGIGVLYGKEEYLKKTKPIIFGGGMNASFDKNFNKKYHELPSLLEAGTMNIAGVIGLGEAIRYIDKIGIENISKIEVELKDYLIAGLKTNPKIVVYNDPDTAVVSFNYEGIFAQDLAIYLNKYNICVRAGNHCVKMINEVLENKNSCRASLYFYNTKEEIDYFIKVLSNPNIKEEIIM